MGDSTTAQDLLVGHLGTPLGAGARTEVTKQRTRRYRLLKAAADSMASDTTAETLGCDIFADGHVEAIWIKTDADVTGHASNHATITINKRDAAGANSVAVGTYTTDSDVTAQGSLAEFVRKAFDLSEVAGARTVVAGGTFNLAIAKGGSGVVVPISEITIDVRDT